MGYAFGIFWLLMAVARAIPLSGNVIPYWLSVVVALLMAAIGVVFIYAAVLQSRRLNKDHD